MLLTDEEIEACAADDDGSDDMAFARAIEAAILEKLASAEFPEPDVSVVDGEDLYGYATFTVAHSTKQLTAWGNTRYAQGAASQLAEKPTCWVTPDGEGFRMRLSPPVNAVTLGWQELYTRRQA